MRNERRLSAVVLSLVALTAGCTAAALQGHPIPPPLTSVPALGTTAVPTPALPPPPSPRRLARTAMARISARLPAEAISVAVRDETTGATFAYGARRGMWTGSVYKLLVLETLLLERQDSGGFDDAELSDISAMIEQSDNEAGYRMFLDAGGAAALATTAHRLGMRHTVIAAADPTFTTTSARDALELLRCLVQPGPLHRRSQRFALSLMRSVEADQRWGAGILADHGSAVAIKNGWLQVDDDNGPGEDDGSRWLVNTLGIVRMHGRALLVSIFTEHNPDRDTGIRLVEHLARVSAPAVLPAP